ncbi:solute carrier family 35 member B1-like [Rhopilema esculentum]|uniref:solute carrier family 35 member B1-like n=1 Tax=Rhopilema esculentum TaxID=499914 RepID=UPI0031D9B9C5
MAYAVNIEEVKPESSVADEPIMSKKLIFCCVGIFVCYFYYGILQEKITRVPYGEQKEKFTYPTTLVFCQCIVNAIFAYGIIQMYHGDVEDKTSKVLYFLCALTYLGAMLASNTALQYINYPTQVLGKSCKPIPVMVLGAILAKKRYPLVKYLSVLLIVLGVALFLYKDKKTTVKSEQKYGFGELLLIVSLTMDGLTGAIQEKMRAKATTNSHHMMFAVNMWSILVLGCTIVATGEVWRFIDFCTRYPYVWKNMLAFSIMSALGQNFIFMTVSNFGPLPCSIATTTRKFFTILFSVIFFGNSLITRQWYAVAVVFLGLGLDAYFGKSSRK